MQRKLLGAQFPIHRQTTTMNPLSVLLSTAAALSAVKAASIDHDKVQPFAQPEPTTISAMAAVKYKPSLRIDTVDAAGDTSSGLKGTGNNYGDCEGSSLGSQVYGRAVWYNDLWAIMYAWYFPKDSASITAGHRHDWVNVVVWLNSPAQDKSMILGVSTSSYGEKYYKYLPLPAGALNGTSAMINCLADGGNGGYHTVDVTGRTGGKFQDIIMWEQLTVEARTALTDTSFGEKAKVPFIDANFDANLKAAWPY